MWCQAMRVMLAAWLASFGTAAYAQDYPARPVRIIVPFSAGGPADIHARFIGQRHVIADRRPQLVDLFL